MNKISQMLMMGGDSSIDYSGYLAVAHVTTPFVTIYGREGTTFTKISNPDVIPTGTGNGVAFSSDGLYLAVGHSTFPYISIYKNNSGKFTKLAHPDELPNSTVNDVVFSSDNIYLAIAFDGSPYVYIYKRSGDIFTKLANVSGGFPTGAGNGVSFSTNGNYLVVGHNGTPYFSVYKRSGDTFSKLTNPAILPVLNANDATISSDGNYIAVISSNVSGNEINTYKMTADVITWVSGFDLGNTGLSVDFSGDDMLLLGGQIGNPYANIYSRSGDVFTREMFVTGIVGDYWARGVAFSKLSQLFAVATNDPPYVYVYSYSGITFTHLPPPSGGYPPSGARAVALYN